MLFLIPYQIETLEQNRPWANWLIVILCSVVSLIALLGGGLERGTFDALVLDGFSITGLFGHVLLHADIFHLAGNMLFLWVFGNAICTNTNNWIYLATFLACTLISGLTHAIMDGNLAIGASGAVNGIVGVALAMYPLNRVRLFWIFFIRGGLTMCAAWVIILVWFLFDIWGAITGGGGIAYWAHIGGLLSGLFLGLIALQLQWFQLTEFDNRCLLEIIRGEKWE